MKISTSFAAVTFASLLCAGASVAQQPAPSGLTEGMDPAIARRMAAQAPSGELLTIPPASNEWLTWGYDQERTGWNRAETTLTPKNVGKLKQVWSTQLQVPADKYVLSTMTAPIVVAGVATANGPTDMLFILGANDVLFALDARTGKQLWSKSFPNPQTPKKPKEWLCPGTTNDTPTIDKARGLVFFITSDGKLRGLSLADGAERLTPVAMTAPFARAWSLNLIDNVLYSTSGRACGEVTDTSSIEYAAAISGLRRAGTGPLLDASAVNAADVSDLAHPVVTHFFVSGARPAAPWGRGGAVRGPGGVILETSDGRYDPASGDFSESILKVAPKAARLMDSYTPTNWMDNLMHDMSGSASPVVFNFAGKTLAAVSQKEAVLRILDANNLGGQNHMTPLWQSPKLGNDEKTGTDPSRGVWGAIATYENNGRRYLYLPLYGHPSKEAPVFPVTNGPREDGSIMAFEVKNDGGRISAVPLWTSTNMVMPDPPVVANGVVYALSTGGQAMQNMAHPGEQRMTYEVSSVLRSTPVSNMVLYAYDAESGKQLWSSGKTLTDWVHFSEPVVALGKIFVATHDGHVVAFGLNK
ncbi:MAG TPA: PQQ-binding-like beta-propeller repeat protein [Rhizomicrobium sp.]|nr:PQQ-binding-like beta-propeller repeat protein [Rhizomicrobium sp.]